MNLSKIELGCGNNGGRKIEASWLIGAESLEDPDNPGWINWEWIDAQYNSDVPLNVQTNENKYMANDGKIILGSEWLRFQLRYAGGWGGSMNKKLVLPPCKLYLNDEPTLGIYQFLVDSNRPVTDLFKLFNMVADNVDIILELPPGKEAFGVWGQVNKAPKRGGVSTSLNALLPSLRRR